MRIKTFVNGGYAEGGFTSSGGTMTGPLILYADPIQDLEAVTKQYVDNKFASLDASKFTAGILQTGRIPAFTGDITSTNGTANITLVGTNIGVGTYSKVTVNDKGLVEAGAGLSESDLPDLPWSKIDPATIPRTLTGLGINDAVSINGDTITGYLTLNADPTTPNQIATKQYVDNASASSAAFKTGDIVTTLNNSAPANFLRCNGGLVSKTTYAALYSLVGDKFYYLTTAGNGRPWQQQYQLNQTQNTDITNWAVSSNLPVSISYAQVIVTKNRIYILGGFVEGVGVSSDVYTAPINADGSIGAWTNSPSLPVVLFKAQVIITKNRVHLIAGTTGGTTTGAVYTAPINADGTLGSWSTGSSLPGAVFSSQAVVTKKRVYVIGGRSDSAQVNTVYSAIINADGTLGTWVIDSPLPVSVAQTQAVVIKKKIYLISGIVNGGYIPTIFSTTIKEDGSITGWKKEDTVIPFYAYDSQAVVVKNAIYMIGGTGTGGNNKVWRCVVNADGTLGTWVAQTNLPVNIVASQAVVVNNKIHMIGGNTSVYSANFVGGVNDYSPYYDGSTLPTDPNNFSLPDLTSTDPDNSYSFIKY